MGAVELPVAHGRLEGLPERAERPVTYRSEAVSWLLQSGTDAAR